MKRRALAAAFALLLFFSSGCSLLKTEYLSISDYTESDDDGLDEEMSGAISSYSALRQALSLMVQRHEESGKLTFSGYDGTVSDDLALACWEVTSDTALGAFAVDYMSYDLNRIVSYYEAEVYITYRRTKEQVDAVQTLSGASALYDALMEAMRTFDTELIVKLRTTGVTRETIVQSAHEIYIGNPLMIVSEPEVSVSIYPDTGLERIYELGLGYGAGRKLLSSMKDELLDATIQTASGVSGRGSLETAQALALALSAQCEILSDGSEDESSRADSAYGALVEGAADSEGAALAFLALCSAKEVECVVVEGLLDNETHYWNIVTADGVSRHIDVSGVTAYGEAALFTDDEMSVRYRWDTDAYPACEAAGEQASSAEPS